jgi:hypothetical protein
VAIRSHQHSGEVIRLNCLQATFMFPVLKNLAIVWRLKQFTALKMQKIPDSDGYHSQEYER